MTETKAPVTGVQSKAFKKYAVTVGPTGRKRYIRFLVFAPPKTGKTVFSLTAPRPLHIDVEKSAAHYAERDLGLPGVAKPGEFAHCDVDSSKVLSFLRDLESEGALEHPEKFQFPFETIIVDPVSLFVSDSRRDFLAKKAQILADKKNMSFDDAMTKVKIEINEWPAAKYPEEELNRLLRSANCHKIMTAHSAAELGEVENTYTGQTQLKKVDEKAKGGNGNLYECDVILELLSEHDPDNVKHAKRCARIREDRTRTFKQGQIVESVCFSMWQAAIDSDKDWNAPPATTTMARGNTANMDAAVQMCMDNPKIKALAAKLGYSDEALRKGIAAKKGNLQEVLKAMEAKAAKLDPPMLEPEPPTSDNSPPVETAEPPTEAPWNDDAPPADF